MTLAQTITEHDSYLEFHKEDGTIDRTFPVTKLPNVLGLYDYTKKERDILEYLVSNPYVIDDVNGKVYSIGSENGKLYFKESEKDIRTVLEELRLLFK